MNKINSILIILSTSLILGLTGCSIYMAGTKEGVSVQEISESGTRSDVIYKDDLEIVKTKRGENGNVIHEDYFALKPKGSIARAVLHGLFDFTTLGLWEIVGTPIEQHLGKEVYIPIRIYYDENENVNRIEYLQYD